MACSLTLLSWNMNQRLDVWENVLASGADVALLQEAKPPPPHIKSKLIGDFENIWEITGRPWCSTVVGLSKQVQLMPITTQSVGSCDPHALMASRLGTIGAAIVYLEETEEEITIVSLYATWETPIKRTGSSWIYADASVHRLISDLSGLIGNQRKHKIIAAGDLNILYGYGEGGSEYWRKRYDTVFDRFSALGLKFIGPQAPTGGQKADPWPPELPEESCNVPTFRTRKSKPETGARQLDFVFASESIADRLSARAANSIEEWGPSDHCRIYIEFK